MDDLVQRNAPMVGPRCGNNPNVRLTPGDRAAIDDFKAYLAQRREAETADAPCAATFREEPMPDTVYCGERGYHQRHTAWQGSDYYAWLDGDEGAGWDR